MTLPKFDAYDPPMELGGSSIIISNAFEAAKYCCNPDTYPANNLFNQIKDRWLGSKEYKVWRTSMPAKTPPELRKHQSQHFMANALTTSGLVKTHGDLLTTGQFLFHAGDWPCQNFQTTDPLSTSMSPGPAFMNGLWKGKAHQMGFLDLWVLEIATSSVHAFVYKHRGNVNFKQELEVLLPQGVNLSLQCKTTVTNSFPSCDADGVEKKLALNVVHIKVS